ncbi:hypothetical protein Lser_V15G13429 [Lactuca serriola]
MKTLRISLEDFGTDFSLSSHHGIKGRTHLLFMPLPTSCRFILNKV